MATGLNVYTTTTVAIQSYFRIQWLHGLNGYKSYTPVHKRDHASSKHLTGSYIIRGGVSDLLTDNCESIRSDSHTNWTPNQQVQWVSGDVIRSPIRLLRDRSSDQIL